MLKEILFTHDDMDGAGCRILYDLAHQHMKKGTEYQIINCSNNSVSDDVSNFLHSDAIDKNTIITFADICCSKELLQEFKDAEFEVKIFDHHRTNFVAQEVYPNAVIVPENAMGIMQAGTSLLYQFYSEIAIDNPKDLHGSFFSRLGNQKLLQDFQDTVRSYDTYEWKSTDNKRAKELQTLFYLLGMERFCNEYVERLKDPDSGIDLILPVDMKFVEAKIEVEQKAIDGFTPDDFYLFELKGYKVLFTTSTRGASISELAAQFLAKHTEYDIMINCYLGRGGKFEMRTVRDDIDLGGEIALPIGGGGHPKAAGAPFPQELNDKIVDAIIDVLKLSEK